MATANIKKEIFVYGDWQGIAMPNKMGTRIVTPARGKETFSFEYAAECNGNPILHHRFSCY